MSETTRKPRSYRGAVLTALITVGLAILVLVGGEVGDVLGWWRW